MRASVYAVSGPNLVRLGATMLPRSPRRDVASCATCGAALGWAMQTLLLTLAVSVQKIRTVELEGKTIKLQIVSSPGYIDFCVGDAAART